jgi:predicted dehydrogenase
MTLNVAAIGAGNISRAHLAALTETEDANVVGVFDADPAKAEQRAAEFGIGRIYRTWDDLLGDSRVDVVAVLVPPDLHHRFSAEALQAGKHVVCEKPMAASLAECDAMIDAARRAGRKLFVVQNRIYSHAYEQARELIQTGAIGTVFLAQSNGFEGPNTVWRSPWLASGRGGNGVLMAQSVHPTYTLRWFFGDVEQVFCTMGTNKVIDMVDEDTAIMTLRFSSGVLAELTATFGLAKGPFDHAIFAYGTEGYVEIRSVARAPSQPQTLRVISPQTFGDDQAHDVELPPVTNHAAQFQRMWEDYLRSIESGQAARVGDVDGRKAVEIILAAHRSNELGRAVSLPLA